MQVLAQAAVPAGKLGIVDTHTHFYDPSRPQGVPWPPDKSPLYRTVLPDDWKRVAKPCGVTQTIVVEASKWLDDNDWVLELAAGEPAIVGFVGNVPPDLPEFAVNVKRLARNPVFRGIRVSGKALQAGVENGEFLSGMKLLAELDLSLDVVGGPDMLSATARLSREVPDLRIIIDHVGNPGPPDKLSDLWKDGMREAGKGGEVFCKVSAVAEQAGNEEWGTAPQDAGYYQPILNHVWECFGEDRVVFGSNWPMSDKATPYEFLFRLVDEYFTSKGEVVRHKYFRGNSMAAYRWKAR